MLSRMGKTGQESGGDSCGTNSALTTSASKTLGGQAAGVCVQRGWEAEQTEEPVQRLPSGN